MVCGMYSFLHLYHLSISLLAFIICRTFAANITFANKQQENYTSLLINKQVLFVTMLFIKNRLSVEKVLDMQKSWVYTKNRPVVEKGVWQ